MPVTTQHSIQWCCKSGPDEDRVHEIHDVEFNGVGFSGSELYLSVDLLAELGVDNVVNWCENIELPIATVHTPHVNVWDGENVKDAVMKATEVARRLDAVLVLDVNPIATQSTRGLGDGAAMEYEKAAIENDPGVSSYYLERHVLQNEVPFILDTAHLHIAEKDILPFVETVLRKYQDSLLGVHLADGTPIDDGCAFGEGDVPISEVVGLLYEYEYDGPVILESPVGTQVDALRTVAGVSSQIR